jgi:hypothetical protein
MIDEPIVGGFGIGRLRLSDRKYVRSEVIVGRVRGSFRR